MDFLRLLTNKNRFRFISYYLTYNLDVDHFLIIHHQIGNLDEDKFFYNLTDNLDIDELYTRLQTPLM